MVIATPEVEVSISRARGTVTKVTSLLPSPLDVLPETPDGLSLMFTDRWTGRSSELKRLLSVSINKSDESEDVSVSVAPDDEELAELVRADIDYRCFQDRFQIKATIRYLKDAVGPFEVVLGQKNPRLDFWSSQAFPGVYGNLDVLSPELTDRARQDPTALSTVVYQRFNGHPNDVGEYPGCKQLRFPYGIFEGPDRFMIYAQMDVNGYVHLGAGHEGRNPAMLITPASVIGGDSHTFDLTYKFIVKTDEQDFADVCLWYSQNCYSTNRLTGGIVAIPGDLKPRTLLSQGNEAGSPGFPTTDDGEFLDFAEAASIGHLWTSAIEWDEVPTLEDSYLSSTGSILTRDSIEDDLDFRHRRGMRSYNYRRQLFPYFAFRHDRPWKREWMLRTKPGTVFVCPSGPESPLALPYSDGLAPTVEQRIREELGIATGEPGRCSWVHADFCNDDCREYYTRALKEWIDANPAWDGYAFDMGWDIHTTPCLVHPEDGTHHGIVRLMAEVYKHIVARHPEKRVVMNMLQGSPSNLWCHAVMFEGGVDMSYEGIESVKIYRATMFAHNYIWQHKSTYGDEWVERLEYNLLSNLGLGVLIGIGDVMTWARDPNFNNKLDLYALSGKMSSHPLVIETGAFLVDRYSRREVYRSVFADAKVCHALLFNNTDSPKRIRATIRSDYLGPYGWNGSPMPQVVRHFDSRGYLLDTSDFGSSRQRKHIVIEGTLGPGQLVAVTSD